MSNSTIYDMPCCLRNVRADRNLYSPESTNVKHLCPSQIRLGVTEANPKPQPSATGSKREQPQELGEFQAASISWMNAWPFRWTSATEASTLLSMSKSLVWKELWRPICDCGM